MVGSGVGELPLRVGDATCDFILSPAEFVDGDGIGEVGVNELALGVFKPSEAFRLLFRRTVAFGIAQGQSVLDTGPERRCDGVFDHLGGPVVGHVGLDERFGQVGQIAVGALLAAAEAEEVAVAITVSAAGVAEAEALVAASATQAPDEVVPLLPGPIPGVATGSSDGLDPLPGVVVNERLVLPGVQRALVYDVAEVVGAGEDAMNLASGERRR